MSYDGKNQFIFYIQLLKSPSFDRHLTVICPPFGQMTVNFLRQLTEFAILRRFYRHLIRQKVMTAGNGGELGAQFSRHYTTINLNDGANDGANDGLHLACFFPSIRLIFGWIAGIFRLPSIAFSPPHFYLSVLHRLFSRYIIFRLPGIFRRLRAGAPPFSRRPYFIFWGFVWNSLEL